MARQKWRQSSNLSGTWGKFKAQTKSNLIMFSKYSRQLRRSADWLWTVNSYIYFIIRRPEARKRATLALKPRADVTRRLKQGYQWPHKKDLCPTKLKKIKRGTPSRGLKVVRAFTNFGGGGAHGILMLSSNLLMSKIPMLGGGGACGILMLSSNLLKSKIPMLRMGGWGSSWNFDAEFKFANIQNSHVGGGPCGILMLSSNLLKSKIPMLRMGGWGSSWNFDAEFKFAKFQNSHVEGGLMEFWCWFQIC